MNTEIDFDQFQPAVGRQAPKLTGREFALIVDAHASALWRGEEDIEGEFYRWLSSHWIVGGGTEPSGAPVARSQLAAGGLGIRWFETADELTGYVPGRKGAHYVISKSEIPPRLTSPKAFWPHRPAD